MTTGNTSSNFHRLNARTFTVTLPTVIDVPGARHARSSKFLHVQHVHIVGRDHGHLDRAIIWAILDHDGVFEDRHFATGRARIRGRGQSKFGIPSVECHLKCCV